MNIKFPIFPGSLGPTLQIAFQTISTAFMSVVSKDEGTERIILRSPNGTTYAVTTNDAGVITTTAISGKQREI